MTRIQWRRYQRNKKAGKEAPTLQLKSVETSGQKRQLPKGVWVEKGKIVANQTIAMIVDPTGKKGMVSSQSMKCSPRVEKEKKSKDALKSNEEEPKYSPQSDEGEPEYSHQSDEEFDEDM